MAILLPLVLVQVHNRPPLSIATCAHWLRGQLYVHDIGEATERFYRGVARRHSRVSSATNSRQSLFSETTGEQEVVKLSLKARAANACNTAIAIFLT